MEIRDIKSKLEITQVAQHLGIKLDKTNKALCPFHADKTPSLQFSKEKQICTCFSSNCNFGTQDIIGFTERKLNLSKHEALKYLSQLAGDTKPQIKSAERTAAPTEPNKIEILKKAFTYFENSLTASSPAKNYLKTRNLDLQQITVGYNNGTQHHKNKELIQELEQVGLLKKINSGYAPFGLGSLVFPLKNKTGEITGLYFRAVEPRPTKLQGRKYEKHLYLKNRVGLYPHYPEKALTKLILTESIIDCATLLQNDFVYSNFGVLAMYGTNGLTDQHKQAIQELDELQEIILFLDGDEAGRKATAKYSQTLHEILPKIKISLVETPDNEDISSLTELYPENYQEVITELINKRKKLIKQGKPNQKLVEKYPFLFSLENKKSIENKNIARHLSTSVSKVQKPLSNTTEGFKLNTENKHKIIYTTENATYYIKGGLSKTLDNLKITLEIKNNSTERKSRTKLDLYEDKQTEKTSREAGEKLGIRADLIELDLNYLTDLLDNYRESQLEENKPNESTKPILTIEEQQKTIKFLKQENLILKINKLIEKSGISGEENNRLFLFVIASSYKMYDTLHALIQGSSGSGKTYLSKQITDLMPKEDVIRLTRVTESSFYNFGEYEIQYKLIVLEDIDGLKEEAEYAFRELQSNGEIISGVSTKNENTGEFNTIRKVVKGPIGSIATTTQGEIYEDNMSRIFLLAVDEGKQQTTRIINYLNQKSSGMINKTEEIKTKEFIQNCVRMLKPYQVINPYANKILLPPEAHKIRRLTELYHSFINQITLINQYQRKKDRQGRLITEKEDVQIAINLMFESIVLKIDELDGSLRQFYESLKAYIMKQGEEYKNYQFTQREIRQTLLISKTACQNNINKLVELEYINKTITSQRNTFHYKIEYWDSLQALRNKIKNYLNNQLENL